MLRVWHSVGVEAGEAVLGAAGAGRWTIGAMTESGVVETQLGFRP